MVFRRAGKRFSIVVIVLLLGIFLCVGVSPAAAQGPPALSVSAISGQPGAVIQVPVNLASDGQVAAVQFELTYNSQMLEYQSASAGTLTAGYLFQAMKKGSDTVKVIVANPSGNSIPQGTGSVAVLDFKVIGSAGQNSSLQLGNSILASPGAQSIEQITVSSGQFTVPGNSDPPAGGGGGGGGGGVRLPALEVETLEPADKSEGVALDAVVRVTFKSELRAVDLRGVEITDNSGNKVTNVRAAVEGKTLVISHDSLKNETEYKISVPEDTVAIKDKYVYNRQLGWRFTTVKKQEAANQAPNCQFSDLPSSHWASAIIGSLCKKNIIGGYPDGTFGPENNITRAEFTVILSRAIGLNQEKTGTTAYSDVAPSDWYFSSIQAAARAGLVKGYGTGEFRPGAPITRQEVAIILVRAMDLEGAATAGATQGTSFTDDGNIASWARGFVVTAVQKGLISGYPDNTFGPESNATRAEACAMINRLMDKKI